MALTRNDYDPLAVQAAKSVLLEAMRLLGEYAPEIRVVGGSVPPLLLPGAAGDYVGTTDVDIAFHHQRLQEPGYKQIRELLVSRGYAPDEKQPFIFYRRIEVRGESVTVELDLLAGEYQGTGRTHRTQKAQDVQLRKARGCDLAFELYQEVKLEGLLPSGGQDSTIIRIAGVVPFLVMKGMAIKTRLKEKDPYDISFCVQNYPGGISALAEQFKSYLSHGLVREGLANIREKFATLDQYGPKAVADFAGEVGLEERARLQRAAFEQVSALLRQLRVT